MKKLNPLKLTLLGSLIAVSFVACKSISPSDEVSDVSSSNDQGIWERLKNVPTINSDDIHRPNFKAESQRVISMDNFGQESTVNAMQMLRTALMEPLVAGKITEAGFLDDAASGEESASNGMKEIVMKNGGMPIFGFGPYTDYFYAEIFFEDLKASQEVPVSGVIIRTPGKHENLFNRKGRRPSFDNFLVTVYTITPVTEETTVKFHITAETRGSSTNRTLRNLGKGPAQEEMRNALGTQLDHAEKMAANLNTELNEAAKSLD